MPKAAHRLSKSSHQLHTSHSSLNLPPGPGLLDDLESPLDSITTRSDTNPIQKPFGNLNLNSPAFIMSGFFPNDLLCLLLEGLVDDSPVLSQCALVNWDFNRAASRVLYSRVVLSPAFKPIERGSMDGSTALLSAASLPHNAPYVQVLRIGGYLSTRPMSSDPLQEALLTAVKAFESLRIVEILPETYNSELFTALLDEIKDRASLINLRVNSSCTDDARAPILAHIVGLRKLELKSSTRAILQLLPDWLGRLTSLKELHLTSNCGSVTPGVLRSFIPLLQNITAFSFGLSYSITDDDLFSFLGQLPCLETVQLQHYLQFKSPEDGTPMKCLRSLTVLHHPSDDLDNVDRICAWVIRAISGSPIERIQICCHEFDDSTFAPRSFDALIEHLSRTNSGTLRALDLGGWLISDSSVSLLFSTCVALEEFTAALDIAGFNMFTSLLPRMEHLHTAALQVYETFSASAEDAARLMQSNRTLRRLSINNLRTEGSWISQGDGVHFFVQEFGGPNTNDEVPVSPRAVAAAQHAPAMDVILEED
ncbi:hypothetical protein B0H17DRAFT_1075127 [Mycena rosella]|uniref:F-box domain-containing protein n=1 Tax=Mycena rosella TaxID=1033263 RepID=A0AAD7DAG4_MYCRO|nr:hypothetical protein B0H17DRAFT_1075127 [Mycena rosella]